MTEEHRHPLRRANVDRAKAQDAPDTPQTRAPAYRLAFTDDDFMCRDEFPRHLSHSFVFPMGTQYLHCHPVFPLVLHS